jgi:AraC-like DNA-binding protein
MLFEPTTLAASVSAIADAVRTYGCEPHELFHRAGLDLDAMLRPGSRYPMRSVVRLWQEARVETGDPCIGLIAGQKLKPPALHALGLSWIASPTLLDGLRRMQRYARIANSALRVDLTETGDRVVVALAIDAKEIQPTAEAADMALASVLRMCRWMTDAHFSPCLVTFRHDDNGHISQYIDYFACPVFFAAAKDTLEFELAPLQQPLPAGNVDLACHNDRLAERYLATLDPDRVQDKVRALLLTLLPSGESGQDAVAARLHRSVSTLQRQLSAEGVTYRQVLEETRASLARELILEQRYSLSQIAYLLGFADQANFSRAFKRWTGESPGRFRSAGSAAPVPSDVGH